ncbi:NACHT domain-containing protein [Leptolyngbya sp. NIES-2104]|uniref:NACHT domain-containing protein n=1 Tax=Leptolyngbya sp. NIES-2104 TaxID=1552121 RepID=UPI00073EE2F9|nr:NACHT domain-containing protein [Leptolyngbya sp. NIES-2104]
MARPSYGAATQSRSRILFTVLLDYANEELDVEECSIEALRSQIQTHWQSDRRLIVRTKVRFLETLTKLIDSPLTADQIKESLRRFEDFLDILEDNRPNRSGSEVWHFTLNFWHSRLDRDANLRAFDQAWEIKRSPQSKPETVNPWVQICRDSLEAQHYQRLTTNPLTITDGFSFDVHELYVPLEIVERQEEEEERVYSIAQFLDHLEAKQRIAIVGEPGAGKTTLLQQIATWLINQNALPIWISLADLQGETLEQYLLNTWLKQATRKISVASELQESFAEQFRTGKVWLLLDAIDEMAIEASVALTSIARQLRGWISDAHIVLTCRSNVWDNGKNSLESFTTYQNLSFREQTGEFIDRWFQKNPELGDRLRQELNKPERKRIRDAVRNPLRLALMCRSWSLTQGALPNTKSTLYQQFAETIYAWKQDYFPTTPAQRQQLNYALGQVALRALSQSKTRFRLPDSFVQQAFGSAIDLMPLALQLGWLNQVATLGGEKIYAFYHSSFQEYFAAQAIDDWRFFFEDFAIFQSQWREVIFLWLGRTDLAIAQKESFIQALIEFDDRCGGFYSHRAFFLAASGLSEFPQSQKLDEIVIQLIQYRFGNETLAPIREAARIAVLQTDRQSAIAELEKFVSSTPDLFVRWTAAYTLGKTLDQANSYAVKAMIETLNEIENTTLKLNICDQLEKINPGNQIAAETLNSILDSTDSETSQRKAAYILGKNNLNLGKAISTLERLIESTQNSTLKLQAAENLIVLDEMNAIALSVLTALPTRTQPTSTKPPKTLNVERTIATLEQRLTEATDPINQRRLAYRLATLSPGHQSAIDVLLSLLLQPLPSLHKRIVENLKDVLLEEQLPLVVDRLKEAADSIEIYKLLWYCSERMNYRSFAQAWNQRPPNR